MRNPNCLHCQISDFLEEKKAKADEVTLVALLRVAADVINQIALEDRAPLLLGSCAILVRRVEGVNATITETPSDDDVAPAKLHS